MDRGDVASLAHSENTRGFNAGCSGRSLGFTLVKLWMPAFLTPKTVLFLTRDQKAGGQMEPFLVKRMGRHRCVSPISVSFYHSDFKHLSSCEGNV